MRVTDADAIASVQVIDAVTASLTLGDWGRSRARPGDARAGEDVARWTAQVHPTAEIEPGVEIGAGTTVWSDVHVVVPDTSIGVEVHRR